MVLPPELIIGEAGIAITTATVKLRLPLKKRAKILEVDLQLIIYDMNIDSSKQVL